jgi:hypothetical protein
MKCLNRLFPELRFSVLHYFLFFIVSSTLIVTSCTPKPEPYSIVEFSGEDWVSNYSKSQYLFVNKSDSLNSAVVLGSKGDLLMSGDYFFLLKDTSTLNKVTLQYDDSILYVNGKISSIIIPGNDNMIPWLKKMKEQDLSALQIIHVESEKNLDNYLPFLRELAGIKPNAGLFFEGDLKEMAKLLKIFHPNVLIGPTLLHNNYKFLSGLKGLKILMISLGDSLITDPLPPMPALEQLSLLEIKQNVVMTPDFLENNKQLKKMVIEKSGSLDLSILHPLNSLKELVIRSADTILNLNRINEHQKLEVLSVTGDELTFDPSLIKLPGLRWITIPGFVTQHSFNALIETHPNLEVVEIVDNDTISNLQSLTQLPKLMGLTIMDTVIDVATVKTLKNLKYLSLPEEFMKDSIKKAEIQQALPNTRIVANEGFCLGSGWLLLLIPLALIFIFIGRREKHNVQES